MLGIIKGSAAGGRDEMLFSKIENAVSQGKDVLVIIPDQYSFEYDRKLYRRLGAKSFNRIETLGTNRLAELMLKKFGGSNSENASAELKLIMMFKAVTRAKKDNDLRCYRRAVTKGSFAGEMLAAVRDFMRSGLLPGDIRIASERVRGSLSGKLWDLSKIYESYLEELEAAGLKDSLTLMSEAVELAKDSRWFSGKTVFVDGFTGFSLDEYSLLECVISQAEDVFVSLLLASEGDMSELFYPFGQTIKTCDKLKRIAEDNNIPTDEIECKGNSAAGSLAVLGDRLCGITGTSAPEDGRIRIVRANDIYEEADFVCAEITHLIRDEGFGINDIAVSARDLNAAAPVLEGTLKRYGLPYFIDRPQSADDTVIAIYLKSIFECVLSDKYKTEAILKYIKSPLCKMLDFDIEDLESYCCKWNVKGDMWTQEFTAGDTSDKKSTRREEMRRKIIEPLERFKTASEDADCSAICRALFDLLDEIDITSQIYSVVKRGSGDATETETELARTYKQLWTGLVGCFTAIDSAIGTEKLTFRQFFELFSLMLSQIGMSQPPQKLECIRCVNAESSRLDNVKILFAVDMNDGVFPAEKEPLGLFAEKEKQQLEALDLDIGTNAAAFLEGEKLVLYRTLTLPSERLYAAYTCVDSDGKQTERSGAVFFIEKNIPNCRKVDISALPVEFFCTTYKAAYYKLLENSKERLVPIVRTDDPAKEKLEADSKKMRFADSLASVEAALSKDEYYKSKLSAMKDYKEQIHHSLSPDLAKQIFVKDKMHLSASRLDDFYNCPYMYYCKHGLKLKTFEKVDFGPMYRGNYLHRCLETVMTKSADGEAVYDDRFPMYTEEQLREKIHQAFLKYRAEEIGGDYGKNDYYFAQLDKYEQEVLDYVLFVQKELSSCEFVPQFFEFKLSDDEKGTSLLELKISDELTVTLAGSVDRADVYTDDDGTKYLRIIDYKTGSMEIDLAKLYHGLNLQMLIYMLAMTESLEGFEPAAALYMKSKVASPEKTPDKAPSGDKLFYEKTKSFKPNGLMIDDAKIKDLFSGSLGNQFIPNGEKFTEEIFKAAEEFTKKKIGECAEKLVSGKIAAEPVFWYEDSDIKKPCTYCDYYGMCGRSATSSAETILEDDKQLLLKELDEIAGKGDEASDE